MATVNKNFRIKNGLVVEGSTATVNGQNILTETGSDTYILNLIGGETLVKSVSSDFAVDGAGNLTANKANLLTSLITPTSGSSYGLVGTASYLDLKTGNGYNTEIDVDIAAVESKLTTDGFASQTDITDAIDALDTDDIEEGTTNLYITEGRVRGALNGIGGISYDSSKGEISVNRTTVDAWYDASGAAATAEGNANDYTDTAIANLDLSFTTDEVTEGTNLYFTTQRAIDAGDGVFDAYGAASTAEGAANTYTDNAINGLDTDDIEEGASNQYFTTSRAVNAVTDVLGSGLIVNAGQIAVDTTVIASQTYVDNAIDNLVDGAPGLLDTLNEIAAAINDDANYFTTIATEIAGKQDTLTAGSNIDITSNIISVTGLDTDDVSEGTNLYFTDERAIDAVSNADIYPNAVIIDNVAKQVAATTGNIATAAATTALAWTKADYRSGKFTVKVKNGSHTEVSEILVTLDTSDNVAITEYGIVGTNGSLSTVSADVSGTDVRIRVTPANDNSEVMVVGTLLI